VPPVAAARADAGVTRAGADKSRPAGSPSIATTRGQPGVPAMVAASGTGTAASPLIVLRDYDPKQFDPNPYYAKVTALARQIVPDAQLTLVRIGPVLASGRVDLTLPGADTHFMFVSPSKQAEKPVGVPANTPHKRSCFVMVHVSATDIRAYSTETDNCGGYLPMSKIQCTTQELWKRAIELGQKADLSATLTMLQTSQGKSWSFSTGGTSDAVAFNDDCKAPSKATDADPRGIFFAKVDVPFEPIRFAKTAQDLARRLEPDATLTEIDVLGIGRDGTIDLALDDSERRAIYRFESAARAKDPAQVDKNKVWAHGKPFRWCQINVILGDKGGQVMVARAEMSECKSLGGRLPRCSGKQLWAKVLAKDKADPGPTAYMYFHPSYTGHEWEVATSGDADSNNRIYDRDVADDCK
jgi:hypothetical protein